MMQLFLLTIAFTYGLLIGSIYKLIHIAILKTENMHVFFNSIFFLITTIFFIIIFYNLNYADIHLYLKIVLIIGFIISFKSVKFK